MLQWILYLKPYAICDSHTTFGRHGDLLISLAIRLYFSITWSDSQRKTAKFCIKALHYQPFVRWIHRSLTGGFHSQRDSNVFFVTSITHRKTYSPLTKGSELRKAFSCSDTVVKHDDVIKWKRFARYWPFVRGIHRWPVNSPHKGQWHGALVFSLICAWINGWVNNREAGDLRRHRPHFDATVMISRLLPILL